MAKLRSDGLSALESEGLIKRFKYTWELAWKTLRDLLAENGVQFSSTTPVNVLRAAQAASLIENGDIWIEAMKARDQMSHEYSRPAFDRIIMQIETAYYPLIEALIMRLELERGNAN